MGGVEESPTVAAVQDGHFAEPPRHDRILTCIESVAPGFRSRLRDYAAERTHTPHAVMEAALAQTIRSKVEAAYARRIRRPSRSTRSLTTVSPPRPGLRTETRRPSAAGSSGPAQT